LHYQHGRLIDVQASGMVDNACFPNQGSR
jgi:hypothetical protein